MEIEWQTDKQQKVVDDDEQPNAGYSFHAVISIGNGREYKSLFSPTIDNIYIHPDSCRY